MVNDKTPIIKVEGLTKNFGDLKVLKGINETIYKGEKIAIIGPSGSGKSTFLRCLNFMEKPTDGHIYFNEIDLMDKGTDITQIRQKVGMVFQHFNLFPHLTVLQNMTLAPVQLKLKSKEQAEADAIALLEKVGLVEKANEYPNMLSGGQNNVLLSCVHSTWNQKLCCLTNQLLHLTQKWLAKFWKLCKTLQKVA